MEMFRFGTCEFCFPIWGRFAMEAAHEAGFMESRLRMEGDTSNPTR